MKRLTGRRDGRAYIVGCPDFALPKIVGLIIQQTVDRLAAIEDILGDEYDLDRLRELAEADREGRCVVLPRLEPVLPRLEPGQGDPPGELGPPGPPGIAEKLLN